MTASQGEESIVIATTGDPAGIPITTNLGIADAGPDAMTTGIGFRFANAINWNIYLH